MSVITCPKAHKVPPNSSQALPSLLVDFSVSSESISIFKKKENVFFC